jgi:hypothetical protein
LVPRCWSANLPDGYTGTHLVMGLIGFDCSGFIPSSLASGLCYFPHRI